MAKNSKQSSSLLTKCFRVNKIISTPECTKATSCPISSVMETIQTIDQMVKSTESNCNKQQGDSYFIQKTMNIEQIEEMLIKWTHIARFLVDAYQQVQTSNKH